MKYYGKKYLLTSFSKAIFYFEDNENSLENCIHELKNIKRFSSLVHGHKSYKNALAFLKLCLHLC